MKRGRPSTGGNSRSTEYYVKKVKPSDAKGCGKIFNYFSMNNQGGTSTLKAETASDSSLSNPDNAILSTLVEDSTVNLLPAIDPIEDDSFSPPSDAGENSNLFPAHDDDNFEKMFPAKGDNLEQNKKSRQCPLNIEKYEKLNNWIYYSVSSGGFFCKLCSVSFSVGPWIDQCVKLGDHPTRCISRHEDSSKHKQAAAASKIKPLSQSLEEGSKVVAKKAEEANKKLLTKYIKILYFMIRRQWAVTENFASLVTFIGEDLGDKDIEMYLKTCSKNATYLSSVSVENLTEAISIFLEEKTLTSLQLCGNFALLADESTDEAQREQLGLVVRYKVLGLPEIKEEYLGLINLSKTNAESISAAIEKFFLAKNISITDCFFLSLDGANVMSGEISGVQRRMRHLSPHSLYINCRNHRLALVFAHLLKKFSLLQAVDALLVSLWKVFHYSSSKQQIFKDIQKDVYAIDVLKILKVSATRWLSHGLACERIIERYVPLVETLDTIFDKTREPEMKGIREQLLDTEILLCILFLADFLKIVNKLSKWLQCPNIMFSMVSINVSLILEEADKYFSNMHSGEHFKKCNDLLIFAKEHTELSMKTRQKKKQLNPDEFIDDFKENFVKPFIEDFKKEMDRAFKIDSEVLGAFDLFSSLDLNLSTRNDPDKTCLSALLSFYGQEQKNEFQGAIKVSKPVIDDAAAIKEVPEFEKEVELAKITFDLEKGHKAKTLLRHNKKEQAKQMLGNKITPIEVLKIISKSSNNLNNMPNMMKLLSLSTIIPSSTASVERLFSQMNLVCTELRTRLKQSTLDKHLRIILNGPEKLSDVECEEIINI